MEPAAVRLLPRRQTRVVVYGDASTQPAVQASAQALRRLGYSNVHILQGGIEAWKNAGYATFAGVNLPSKTFGELAEHAYQTPSVSAGQLQQMLDDGGQRVVVLDGRPVNEYRKMNIPGSICCPNGELALRIGELAPDPDTTIVINCAGRTRSIIGAQTLINLGIPNKIYALENGTQGWYLEDFPLEHQSSRLYPQQIHPDSIAVQRERAGQLIERFGLRKIACEQVEQWLAQEDRTVFLCDVRTEEEHRQGDLPSIVRHTPGGQLIQATDQYLGVRNARVVLCDTDGVRAPVVASWLKQLGWDVYLLEDPERLDPAHALATYEPVLRHSRTLSTDELAAYLAAHSDAALLDARPSGEYQKVSLLGATWVIRPMLLEQLQGRLGNPLVLIGNDSAVLGLLAQDLERAGARDVCLCVIDSAAVAASGLPLNGQEDPLPDEARIDYLFFVHDRHDGNKEAARKYLEWETGLVAQIDDQERNTFSIGK
jgi:rhodanese-related sulfurtransferase